MSADSYRHILRQGAPGGPLLVLLHGTGGSASDLLPLGATLLPSATLLSPEGDVREGAAARFFRRTAEGVYDMDDVARAAAKLAGFVREHAEALQPSAVLGLGYSNGANVLAATLFADPELLDVVALLHPLIPFEPQVASTLASKPVLVTAGRRDPICPPALTARLVAWLEAEGADVSLEWHEGGHELRTAEIAAAQSLFARFRRDKETSA